MKARWLGLVCTLAGCVDVNLAMDYVGNKPQIFPAAIQVFGVTQLRAYRSEKHPGHIWVVPNPGRTLAAAFNERTAQWAAMLTDTIDPAYRAAAVQALAVDPGGSCEITGLTPWPTQFAIEYAYTCQ